MRTFVFQVAVVLWIFGAGSSRATTEIHWGRPQLVFAGSYASAHSIDSGQFVGQDSVLTFPEHDLPLLCYASVATPDGIGWGEASAYSSEASVSSYVRSNDAGSGHTQGILVRPFRVTGGPGHTEVQIDVELLAYNYGGYGYSMVSWSAAVQGVAELNGTLTGGYIDSTAVFSWIHELNCGETYFLELRMDADTNGNTLLAYLTLVGPAGSPLGACCYGDCEVLAESECQERGGTYLGNGTECAPGNCPTTGACCDALTGVCVVASPQDCGLGGSRYDYLGDGSLCDPNPCATPVGACCASEGCTQTTEAECGGAFLGIGVDCGACATGVDQPAVPIDSKPRALPNPSSGATTITFSLAKPGWTSVRIYDSGGRLVRVLGVGEMTAGQHAMTWDGKSDAGAALPAGVYYSRVETGAGVVTGRVVRR